MSAAANPEIRIPAALLPHDGRFGSGPSKVRVEAVGALVGAARELLGTSHRQAPVRRLVGRVREGLSTLFSLPAGYEVLLGNGGTTLFWDAATFGLIERRSQHLSFGEFSAKFAAAVAATPHLETPDVVESALGTHPDVIARNGVDLYALTHNETSTGVMAGVLRPAGPDLEADAIVAVDGTSGAGGLPLDPTQFDVYYFAPQKCFAADGGLWLALCSPAGIERIERIASSDRWIPAGLDLKIALDNSRLDQTYNTPALSTLVLMAEQVEWMLDNGGLGWTVARCARSAEILYGWAEDVPYAAPFVGKPDDRSTVVATIDFDAAIDANVLSAVLRANGIVDTDSYRKLGRNQLRIAMFPAIDPDDVAALTRSIAYVVERVKT